MTITNEQRNAYIATMKYVLDTYANEKVQTQFEMSIDMCDAVDWDDEDDCGCIFNAYQFVTSTN